MSRRPPRRQRVSRGRRPAPKCRSGHDRPRRRVRPGWRCLVTLAGPL